MAAGLLVHSTLQHIAGDRASVCSATACPLAAVPKLFFFLQANATTLFLLMLQRSTMWNFSCLIKNELHPSKQQCCQVLKYYKAKQRIGHLPFWPTSPSSNLFCAVILLSPYRKPHPLALVRLAILVCGTSVWYVLQGLQVDLQPKLTWFSTTLKHRLEL